MRPSIHRLASALTLILLAVGSAAADQRPRPRYDVKANIGLESRYISGTVSVTFTNTSNRTIDEAVLFLFPNRFSAENELTDLNRQFVYPEEEFDSGSLELSTIDDAGQLASHEPIEDTSFGTAVRVAIAPLAPGESRRLGMGFRTRVPHRYGSFGEFAGQLTLLGGWYPYLAELGNDGAWRLGEPPSLADFKVTITPSTTMQVAINGHFRAGHRPFSVTVDNAPYLSLIASPRLLKASQLVGETQVTLLLRPKTLGIRLVPGPDEPTLIMRAVEKILLNRPAGSPEPPKNLLVIEAPLRMHLIEAAEGMVVYSDRLYQTLGPLRGFHEAHLAQGVYRELLRPELSRREPSHDYDWISEGLGFELARRYMIAKEPERRLLADWLRMFDFLASVDRFEKVPTIPFVNSYFARVAEVDPVRDRPSSFNTPRPPGRVIMEKVRDLVGDEAFEAMLDQCLATPEVPFRRCAQDALPDRAVASLVEQWDAPYPTINYWVDETDFNRPDENGYSTKVTVRRETSRDVTEPVTIRMRTIGGDDVDLQWNAKGDAAILTQSTDKRVYQVYVDPDEKLIETRRDDNAWLPRFEVLIDGADLEVSSTQFGFGANFVSRIHEDYRKDVALTAYYTNRGVGFALGPRLHFGKPIDATRYRHNLHLFYTYTALDSGFERARPDFVTKGNTAGLGFRYDYTNVFYQQNPTLQRQLRVYGDWYDSALGSDYDYFSWGYIGSLVFPVHTRRTLVGLQVANGFTHANGDSVVPNQGYYSLGGSRSIRGIGFGEQLGRNIFIVRGELRQSIYPELNFNLLDLVILRRMQMRAFADSGNVDNSAGRVYDPTNWAVGVGAGFGVVYDAAGFIPAVAFIEIATRVDEDSFDEVQVLFGTKQAF